MEETIEELKFKLKTISTCVDLMRIAKYNTKSECYVQMLEEIELLNSNINKIKFIAAHLG